MAASCSLIPTSQYKLSIAASDSKSPTTPRQISRISTPISKNRSPFPQSSDLRISLDLGIWNDDLSNRKEVLSRTRSLTSAIGVVENDRIPIRNRKKEENPIIVIDNYDSFTYNLCQYIGELGANFEVYRNDEITVEEIKMKNPRGILISPGPGAPQDSGISLQTVLELGPYIPLFGVCMGFQCMGEAFGGKVVRSPFGVVHGKSSLMYYDEKGEEGLFSGLPKWLSHFGVTAFCGGWDVLCLTVARTGPFTAGRYHSLVIDNKSFPSDVLEMTAWTEDGLVMAGRHKKYRHIQGVQFHPESIITSEGIEIIRNFLKLVERMESKSLS